MKVEMKVSKPMVAVSRQGMEHSNKQSWVAVYPLGSAIFIL